MRMLTMIGASVALVLASAAAAQTTSPAPQAPAAKPPAPAATAQPAPSGTFINTQAQNEKLSSDIIGMSVVNREGETLGKIAALILDQNDKVTGVIVSVGGFLGMGSKSVALPWQSVKFETKDRKTLVVIQLSNEQIALAPDYKTLAQQRNEQEAQAMRALQQQQQQQGQQRPAAPAPKTQ
ncbi:MAG: PRC-barrel domain containing protein [Alphaproteobacteria bacterium]|nr:PRC-barrel domain containing protein [Alphaproteobacteria bacterium]